MMRIAVKGKLTKTLMVEFESVAGASSFDGDDCCT